MKQPLRPLSTLTRSFSSKLSSTFIAVFVLIFAFAFFIYLYGPTILNPHFSTWIISNDSEVYFYGFNFFNAETWQHPIGKILAYSYPESASVVYTDSIPHLAILAKMLSKLFFPQAIFQYFGIWVLLCFGLQAGLAYLLLSENGLSKIQSALGSLLFLSLPTFLNRSFDDTKHYSLLGQFLILIALLIYTSEKRQKNLLLWAILLALSMGVHLYLTFVVGFFFALSFSYDDMKRFVRNKQVLAGAAVLLFVAYELGYFTIPLGNSTAGGFGNYAMNLTGPFDSMGRSYFLTALPGLLGSAQFHEGFQFLGTGIIALLIFSLINPRQRAFLKSECSKLKDHWILIFGMMVLITSFQVGVLSYKVMEWFSIPVISAIYSYFRKKQNMSSTRIFAEIALLLLTIFACGKIFRASGRLFWAFEYLGLFLLLKSKPKTAVLFALVAIQFFDLSPFYRKIQEQEVKLEHQEIPTTSVPEKYTSDFDHIAMIGGYFIPSSRWLDLALIHHKTIGPLPVARGSSKARELEKIQILSELNQLTLRDRVLYVVGDEKIWADFLSACAQSKIVCSERFITGEVAEYHYALRYPDYDKTAPAK